MRIAICDDEKQICEFLKEKIRRYYFSNDINFSIQTFENGEKLLESDLNLIDVLFLDVEMPGRNGMKVAKAIRDKIWIYCKEHTYRWRCTLKNLCDQLSDKGFFQVHRSYIINMNKIQKYNSQTVSLDGDFEVPISKYRLNEFKEEYLKLWSKIL